MNRTTDNSHLHFLKSVGLKLILLIVFLGIQTQSAVGEESRILTAENIRSEAEQYLLENLGWAEDEMEVNVKYRGKDLVLPLGDLELNYRLPAHGRKVGRIPLVVQVKVDDVFQRRLRLSTEVKVLQNLVKTRRNIRRGEIITENDVVMEQKSTGRLFRNVATRLEDVVGMEAGQNLRQDQALRLNALRKATIINKGDRVIILARKGAMKISTPGLALENGFADAMLQVKNLQSKKTVYGRVVDANTVEVDF